MRNRIRELRAQTGLSQGQLAEARKHFTKVHLELPGEYAPKLALAYCGELLGDGPVVALLGR